MRLTLLGGRFVTLVLKWQTTWPRVYGLLQTNREPQTFKNVGKGARLWDGRGVVSVAENQTKGTFVLLRGDDDRVHYLDLHQFVFVGRILDKIFSILYEILWAFRSIWQWNVELEAIDLSMPVQCTRIASSGIIIIIFHYMHMSYTNTLYKTRF